MMKLKCVSGNDLQIGVVDTSTLVIFGDPALELHSSPTSAPMSTTYLVGRAKDVEYLLRQAREKVNFPANALLIHGPPGTGKSHLVKQVTHHLGYNLVHITASHILDLRVANPFQSLLRQHLQMPSDDGSGDTLSGNLMDTVLFFDDIDVLLADDEVADLESQRKVIIQFEQFLESLRQQLPIARNCVSIIGCTHSIASLNPSTRRLFEREIAVDLPPPTSRHLFLKTILSQCNSASETISEAELKEFSEVCHGFSLSDLETLVRVASTQSVLRSVRSSSDRCLLDSFPNESSQYTSDEDDETTIDDSEPLPSLPPIQADPGHSSSSSSSYTTMDDLRYAKSLVKAESLKSGLHLLPSNSSRFSVSAVSGLDEAMSHLIQSTTWMYKYADKMASLGVSAPKGVLLFGPPGTGKTMLAKCVASESSANFLSVSISDLVRGEIGGSEMAIATLFRTAKSVSPCVIFLDEMQALFGARDASSAHGKNMIAQLTLELDALTNDEHVVIIGATNRPDWIDPALLRPGRFERCLYIAPPSETTRAHILRNTLKRFAVEGSEMGEAFIAELAKRTNNFSGADLNNLCLKAAWNVIKERYLPPDSSQSKQSGQRTPTKRFTTNSFSASPSFSSPSNSSPSHHSTSFLSIHDSLQSKPPTTKNDALSETRDGGVRHRDAIAQRHILEALSEFSPTITKEMLVLYQQFQNKYGRAELQRASHGDPYDSPITPAPSEHQDTSPASAQSRFEQMKLDRMRQLSLRRGGKES